MVKFFLILLIVLATKIVELCLTATAFGLPYLEPYKKAHANFEHGVNFAVAGATALSEEALKAKNITNPATNSSLSVQLEWMASHFNSTCHTKQG